MTSSPADRKIVLVTGSSSGIGKACCEQLGKHAIVYGASRTGTHCGAWTYLRMDVTDSGSIGTAIDSIMSAHGRIDALIHCAGSSLTGPVEETGEDEALAQFDTNYFGTLRVLRHVLPVMRRQNSGTIVVIGSIGGIIALPFQAHYSATKFALDGLVEALRHEVRPFNIHACILHPGNFRTALNENRVRAGHVTPLSPYSAAFERAADFYAREEIDAPSPEAVARRAERIILARARPRVRYIVGSPLERLGVLAKRVLPSALFERVTRLFYFP